VELTTGSIAIYKPTVWAKVQMVGFLLLLKKECNNFMKELKLKYGCNPNQKPAKIFIEEGELPIKILNGSAGYINLLDAFNSWQLVKELKAATGLPAAASFKHVSPAGAAVAVQLTDDLKKAYFIDELSVENVELSDIATAYARARGADRMSSYGDFVALSDMCDEQTAKLLSKEVSDGIISPAYSKEALEILRNKRKGNYLIIQIDPNYIPKDIERKEVYGITFEQKRNDVIISEALLTNLPTKNKTLPDKAKRDLIIALITLKYTQSNSVCYVKDGQAIGIGAGQQSRIHCTRLAGNKADAWFLRQNPKVLNLPFKLGIKRADRDNAIDVYISEDYMDVLEDGTWENIFTKKPAPLTVEEKKEWLKNLKGVSLGSDAFFPFGDNIERAYKSGVAYIAQTGGSIRDDNVIEACDKYGIAMAFTTTRLFHH
jgi:phosphoribosylaminoimidazolecarboxamide formyltransferase/IMP cyclohydrolase